MSKRKSERTNEWMIFFVSNTCKRYTLNGFQSLTMKPYKQTWELGVCPLLLHLFYTLIDRHTDKHKVRIMSKITKVNFQNWNHFCWPHLTGIKYWIHFHLFFHSNLTPAFHFHSISPSHFIFTRVAESISVRWKNIRRI